MFDCRNALPLITQDRLVAIERKPVLDLTRHSIDGKRDRTRRRSGQFHGACFVQANTVSGHLTVLRGAGTGAA